jgi:signal transduction histidine kinase
MLMTWLLIGIAIGLLLAVPIAWRWSRATESRVRELERHNRQQERLAELGTVTAGLAHEIKNPLSTIGLNVQLLQEDLGEAEQRAAGDETLQHMIQRVGRRLSGLSRETHRLRDTLEDFLRFAGRMKLNRQPADLNDLLGELADFFGPQADEAKLRLRTDLTASPAEVSVDGALLKQAVLNLMLNAVQAMQQGRTGEAPHGGCDELLLRTHASPECPGWVRVQVIDTGPGIPPEVLPRIFEPYFSSKRGGSGLGLPTTRRIVEEHGGTLTVHTDPGHGTEFTIELPVGLADGR